MGRKKHAEHANHEAWAIPYGDLVTLLMAFFVVMYAVSVVDAGKYRVLSNSLIEAFGSRIPVDPIQVGEPSQALNLIGDDVRRSLAPVEIQAGGPSVGDAQSPDNQPSLSPNDVAVQSSVEALGGANREKILQEIKEVSQEIESSLNSMIQDGNIRVDRKAYWLEIAVNANLLFASGSATLESAARPVLEDVAKILAKRDARIHVEGHTDNLPIKSAIYPSNWELSSGRAATVVSLFAQKGVNPERMVAIGYGEFQPLADNRSEEGRAKNRRVAVIVLPGPPARAEAEMEPERLKSDYESEIGRIRQGSN